MNFAKIAKILRKKIGKKRQIIKLIDFDNSCIVHDDFDYDLIEQESRMIVDTRGRFKKSEKVIKS